jgi:hypothetical protein
VGICKVLNGVLKRKLVTLGKNDEKFSRETHSRRCNTSIAYFWIYVTHRTPGLYLQNCRRIILNVSTYILFITYYYEMLLYNVFIHNMTER